MWFYIKRSMLIVATVNRSVHQLHLLHLLRHHHHHRLQPETQQVQMGRKSSCGAAKLMKEYVHDLFMTVHKVQVNKWAGVQFGGDAARRDKFLALMGAKKHGADLNKVDTAATPVWNFYGSTHITFL